MCNGGAGVYRYALVYLIGPPARIDWTANKIGLNPLIRESKSIEKKNPF